MAKSLRSANLDKRISAALEELQVAYVPKATRLMLCSGIRAAMNILSGGPYGMDCGVCGRALTNAEIDEYFKSRSVPGEIASFAENMAEAAAAEAGWGMGPDGPGCPGCIDAGHWGPSCTEPLMAALLEVVKCTS